MPLDPHIMERLGFAKHLFQTGIEQSQSVQPLASKSILTLHDSVEIFLYITTEHLGISNKYQFMEYWNEVEQQTNRRLGQKAEMNRLNKARTTLKHQGIRPDKSDIDSLVRGVQTFFEENTIEIFGINFSTISLLSLVQYTETKAHLERGEKRLDRGELVGSLTDSALAFEKAMIEYRADKEIRNPKRPGLGSLPFQFGKPLAGRGSRRYHRRFRRIERSSGSELDDFASSVGNSIESLLNVITILCVGIDYRQYAEFNYLVPELYRVGGGGFSAQTFVPADHFGSSMSAQDARFCIDFVIESCLKLQEFDFTLDNS